MNKLQIGEYEILKGENVSISIDLPNLYSTPTKLPIRVIRGKKDGPVVFISASIHGDELNGIEVIRRFRKLSLLKRLKGTLILVPLVNVYGVITLSRYLPDRRDLNRCFPGTENGSLASRIAKIFFEEIVVKCDFGIDLHTGAIHRSNLPQIRINIENEYTLKMAKAFEAPVVLHSPLREGTLRASGEERGIPILLYEAGEALRFNEKCIRIGVKGIANVLKELSMLPQGNVPKSKKIPIIAKSSQWIRARESGIMRMIKALGDTVNKDEIIAYIDETYGNGTFEIRASFDGIIIGRTEIPLVQEGDAVFHIARFKNLESAELKIEYFHQEAIEQNEFNEIYDDESM